MLLAAFTLIPVYLHRCLKTQFLESAPVTTPFHSQHPIARFLITKSCRFFENVENNECSVGKPKLVTIITESSKRLRENIDACCCWWELRCLDFIEKTKTLFFKGQTEFMHLVIFQMLLTVLKVITVYLHRSLKNRIFGGCSSGSAFILRK